MAHQERPLIKCEEQNESEEGCELKPQRPKRLDRLLVLKQTKVSPWEWKHLE